MTGRRVQRTGRYVLLPRCGFADASRSPSVLFTTMTAGDAVLA